VAFEQMKGDSGMDVDQAQAVADHVMQLAGDGDSLLGGLLVTRENLLSSHGSPTIATASDELQPERRHWGDENRTDGKVERGIGHCRGDGDRHRCKRPAPEAGDGRGADKEQRDRERCQARVMPTGSAN
jgi:hypothetical protein